jgi:hypothetical protein
VRDVHRVPDGGAVVLTQPELQQRGRAAGHLEPVHQRRVPLGQAGLGAVRGHPERPGVRRPHRDAVEADRQPGSHPPGQVAHVSGEMLPLVVRLGPVEQQERRPGRVPHQVHGQFRGVVVLPVVPGEGHRWPAGPVVDQPVHIEPGHLLVLERAQQVRGEQLAGRARVDEPVEVVQQGRPVEFRRVWGHLVKVSRLSHHDHSPSKMSARH